MAYLCHLPFGSSLQIAHSLRMHLVGGDALQCIPWIGMVPAAMRTYTLPLHTTIKELLPIVRQWPPEAKNEPASPSRWTVTTWWLFSYSDPTNQKIPPFVMHLLRCLSLLVCSFQTSLTSKHKKTQLVNRCNIVQNQYFLSNCPKVNIHPQFFSHTSALLWCSRNQIGFSLTGWVSSWVLHPRSSTLHRILQLSHILLNSVTIYQSYIQCSLGYPNLDYPNPCLSEFTMNFIIIYKMVAIL